MSMKTVLNSLLLTVFACQMAYAVEFINGASIKEGTVPPTAMSSTNFIEAAQVTSAPTVTVSSATANNIYINLTNNTILAFNIASFPTNAGAAWGTIQYRPNSFSFGLDTNTVSGTLSTPITNEFNTIVYNKPFGASKAQVK